MKNKYNILVDVTVGTYSIHGTKKPLTINNIF
ncbi:MAG: hypothetical protein K0R54_1922 [Clostridiaceae bacterium]|jgi:hypothetical protein|nr:hypothetical protein [Clostridiaceae bacterium]